MRQFVRYRIVSFSRPFQSKRRWALNFDGVGIRGVLAQRVINPDGDIDIEFTAPTVNQTAAIVSQCISGTSTSREFQLSLVGSALGLELRLGGVDIAYTIASGFEWGKKYRVTLIGTAYKVYKDGVLVVNTTFTRGSAREPTATTVIGARNNGALGTYAAYASGILRDIKINGVRWPMADYNQAIQLPQPSGLGDELLVNPSLSNNATDWTRNKSVTENVGLSLKITNTETAAGAIHQTVATVVGVSYVLRLSRRPGGVPALRVSIHSSGLTYTGDLLVKNIAPSESDQIQFLQFTATTTATTIIIFANSGTIGDWVLVSDVTVRPLGTCNPMTISNATSTNWMQVVDDYVAKFRKVLRLDGVGARGAFSNRAVNPDGDIDIEFYTPDVFGATKVIVSQNITSTNTAKEFQLETSATGSLIIRLGGAAQNMGTVLPATKYRVSLVGTSLVLYSKDGAVVSSLTFNRGATREPTAITVVGAATNGVANIYAFYFTGIQRDIKINGTLWPISDATQTIQLPEPSGLGAELLDNSPFLEPNGYVNTIVATGPNSFKVLAPTSGATRAAKGFTLPTASETVVLEFDFVSREPDALLSLFIRDGITVGAGTVSWSTNINTLGKQRFIVTNSSVTLKNILFAVNLPCTFEIRNISIKPLGTCNPLRLTNVTSANWEDLEI